MCEQCIIVAMCKQCMFDDCSTYMYMYFFQQSRKTKAFSRDRWYHHVLLVTAIAVSPLLVSESICMFISLKQRLILSGPNQQNHFESPYVCSHTQAHRAWSAGFATQLHWLGLKVEVLDQKCGQCRVSRDQRDNRTNILHIQCTIYRECALGHSKEPTTWVLRGRPKKQNHIIGSTIGLQLDVCSAFSWPMRILSWHRIQL